MKEKWTSKKPVSEYYAGRKIAPEMGYKHARLRCACKERAYSMVFLTSKCNFCIYRRYYSGAQFQVGVEDVNRLKQAIPGPSPSTVFIGRRLLCTSTWL